jgi:hypothetical protein
MKTAFVCFFVWPWVAYSQAPTVTLATSWKVGDIHPYTVSQTTTVVETIAEGGTTTTKTQLDLKRSWTVKAVDAATGHVTLDMAITDFKQTVERTNSSTGAVATKDTLDSANPADAAKLPFLGKAMQTVVLDGRGQVLKVTTPGGGANAESRVKAELPFRVILPEKPVGLGAMWEQSFMFKLAPPQGTGEEIAFLRKMTVKALEKGVATVAVTVGLKEAPETTAEWLPLVPFLWEGEVYWDVEKSMYRGAKIAVKKELANHQGQGSSFRYESHYAETRGK